MLRSARPYLPRLGARITKPFHSSAAKSKYAQTTLASRTNTKTKPRAPADTKESDLRRDLKEAYGTCKDDPQLRKLNEQVVEQFNRKGRRTSKDYIRTQIVSPDLCDDVLKYIGPSLEKHKGCDILDINPGFGRWSQKLHDFLQPRSHILLEWDTERYGEYLQPLVDQPDSTYKLVEADTTEFETYKQLLDNGLFPHQKRKEPGQSPENNTLLVTGTLFWDPKLPGKGFDSMSKQLISHFANMARTNDLFHAFGMARMLWWAPSDDAKIVVPKASLWLGSGQFWLQHNANISEVVTGGQLERHGGRGNSGRQPRYMIESAHSAMERGRAAGMELPAHRREIFHDFVDDVAKMTGGTGVLSSSETSKYLLEQEKAGKSAQGLVSDSTLRSWHLDMAQGIEPSVEITEGPRPHKKKSDYTNNITLKSVTTKKKIASTLASSRSSSFHDAKMKTVADAIVDLGEDIYKLECATLSLPPDSPEYAANLKQLQEWDTDFDRRVAGLPSNLRPMITTALDDRLTIRSPVMRLQWDMRPYEPLIMRPHEVWPPNQASLLDIQPLPSPASLDPDHIPYVLDFLHGLFAKPVQSLTDALENMHHGASDLIDQVPVLRDPKMGGRLNMRNLRVRMLTMEMVDGLTRAWRKWPFRDPDADHNRYFRMKAGSGSAEWVEGSNMR